MIAVFQQLVGINVIFYYGETLWKLAGVSEQAALERNILSGVVSILACIGTILVIDKIGRKPLLLIGSAGMAVSLFAMAYAFHSGTLDPSGKLQLTPQHGHGRAGCCQPLCDLLQRTWGPVMWVMLGEMFPNQIRGSALAVAGFAQWFANYLIAQTFPIMARLEPHRFLPFLRDLGGDQLLPRARNGARNARQGTGADGRLGRSTGLIV